MFPDGPMLQEEAMLVKERLNKDELALSTASNGWLEKFKQTYGIHQTRITDEADDIPKMTIQSWTERLPELTSGYKLTNIWNMDELGLFFTALSESLAEKSGRYKGGKTSKQRYTTVFFVAANGSKISEPQITKMFKEHSGQNQTKYGTLLLK